MSVLFIFANPNYNQYEDIEFLYTGKGCPTRKEGSVFYTHSTSGCFADNPKAGVFYVNNI